MKVEASASCPSRNLPNPGASLLFCPGASFTLAEKTGHRCFADRYLRLAWNTTVASSTCILSSGWAHQCQLIMTRPIASGSYNALQCLSIATALFVVLTSLGCGGSSNGTSTATGPSAPTGTVPRFGHVVLVVEENNSYSQVIGSSEMPHLNSLATQYGLAT